MRERQRITPLTSQLVPAVERLISLGAPFLRVRGSSDYWLHAHLFSSTCPVALIDDDVVVVGVVIAFRSQDDPRDVYVQDVMAHPGHRRRGVAKTPLNALRTMAEGWGCRRIYLTSESENRAAHETWLSLGFANIPGDRTDHGVSVISGYKGPGMDRAVYELPIKQNS